MRGRPTSSPITEKAVRLRAELDELAARFRFEDLYVFGSRGVEIAARVRGTGRVQPLPGSDVDVGARWPRDLRVPVRDKVGLAIALEDLFGVERVDLVDVAAASPGVALDIVRGELLYARDLDAQAAFELYVLRRVADLAPLERERCRLLLAGGAS